MHASLRGFVFLTVMFLNLFMIASLGLHGSASGTTHWHDCAQKACKLVYYASCEGSKWSRRDFVRMCTCVSWHEQGVHKHALFHVNNTLGYAGTAVSDRDAESESA